LRIRAELEEVNEPVDDEDGADNNSDERAHVACFPYDVLGPALPALEGNTGPLAAATLETGEF
jgi:hypothetical protein